MKIEFETEYTPNGTYDLVSPGVYHDGSLVLQVYGPDGPEFTATVCVSRPAGYGCVFIKDWSENEGVLSALLSAGVVGEPVATVPTGFVVAYECPLLVDMNLLRN